MDKETNLDTIVQLAKRKGVFYLEDYPGLSLSLEEFSKLRALLKWHHIPIETKKKITAFSQREAIQIINALRKGVPPQAGINIFSIGRRRITENVAQDLDIIRNGSSLVRFMSAGYGHGKTHTLHLIKDLAFQRGFVVSLVTLSQDYCPIYEFLNVYHEVMWQLRTPGEPNEPALETVLDRWLEAIKKLGEDRARKLIHNLSVNLVNALNVYYQSISPIKPNEQQRLLILKYLSGEWLYLSDLRPLGISNRIEGSESIKMLGTMARLFRTLGFRGLCILFDEAEAIHSLERGSHRDNGYHNLLRLVKESRQFPHCYFLYATTPSFFDDYHYYWPVPDRIKSNDILELDSLTAVELAELATNICQVYGIAYNKSIPQNLEESLKTMADAMSHEPVGLFVRRCIAVLQEQVK